MSQTDKDFWLSMLSSIVRKGMVSVATWLVTMGLLPTNEQTHFVDIGVGLVLGGGALVWDWFKNAKHAKLLATKPTGD